MNDGEAAADWASGIEELTTVAPPRHRPAVEQMSRTATTFVKLGERAGWTADGFASLSPREQQDMAEQADTLALFFTGPVAIFAHETCPDADDPAFTLVCPGLLGFVTGDGRLPGGIVTETPPTPGAPVADPAADAMAALASVPGAVEVRSEEAGDVLHLTYLDGDGRSVRIDELQAHDGSWVLASARRCEG